MDKGVILMFLIAINASLTNANVTLDTPPQLTSPNGTKFCIYENANPDALDCALLEDGRVPLLEAVFFASSDADASAQLVASIDWDQTRAKSGCNPVTPGNIHM